MLIKEINKEVFDNFSKSHLLNSEYQTSSYADIKHKQGYDVTYIGAYKNGTLLGASMILVKLIATTIKYGYAPRGFLIDYYNKDLFTEFTKALKSYFLLKNFAFIKIDPEIIYSIVDPINKIKNVNDINENLILFLKSLGYQKLKPTLYFDSMMPTYNPIIDLTSFKLSKLDETVIADIKRSERLGLNVRIGDEEDIESIYDFIKDKKNRTLAYYKEYYKSYKKNDEIEIALLELDYTIYLKLLQDYYEDETENNTRLNKEFINSPKDLDLLNTKMASDKKLNDIKNEIIAITRVVKENNKFVIAGALISKLNNRINIIINGYDKSYPSIQSKLYLFYYLIMHYKNEGFEYMDMNGITLDFTDSNPYKSLNEFKLKFKPIIYEYIGEFDLVINAAYYQMLWSTGKLHKEFQKERISN